MKTRIFLSLFAAAGMLLAASCTNDELTASIESEGGVTVSFSIGLEDEAQTRAISDGTSADKLVFAIYNSSGSVIESITSASVTVNGTTAALEGAGHFIVDNETVSGGAFSDLKSSVSMTLAKGQQYTVLFWAQDASCAAYDTDDLKAVEVDYTANSGFNNDETRDAFYAAETFTVTQSKSIDVTLKRPFAQVNVGVTEADWNAAKASGIEVSTSSVKFYDVADVIDLSSGKVSKSENFEGSITYAAATIPNTGDEEKLNTNSETLTVNGTDYYWLSMSYILVNDGTDTGSSSATTNADFTFTPASGANITLDLTSVPVQRNYRTNILGKILSGDIEFDIVIDKAYNDPDKITEFWDGTTTTAVTANKDDGIYYVSTASELAWIAEQVNEGNSSTATKAGAKFSGATIQLTNDIYLNNQPWTPIGTLPEGKNVKDDSSDYKTYGFQGTFNGDGYTIYGLNASSNNATGLFGALYGNVTIKDVIVDGATVTSNHYAGVIAGYYNAEGSDHILTIDNCDVKNSSVSVYVEKLDDGSYDNGDKAGGIIGHSAGYGWTVSITNCSVESTSISAYRDLGGIIGNIVENSTETTLTNNKVTDVTLTIDLSTTYSISSGYNPGEIAGRNDGGVDVSNNTSSGVTIEMNLAEGTSEVEISGGDATSLVVAINDENIDTITLTDETTVTEELSITSDKTIDLNGYTLTSSENFEATEGNTLTISDGTITQTDDGKLVCTAGGSMVIENVTYTGTFWSSVLSDKNAENTTITIRNSYIKGGYYSVNTNASTNPVGTTVMELENSTFIADETAFLMNVPSTVTATGCTFQGGWQAAFLRGGTSTFTDCKFNLVMDPDYNDVPEKHWTGAGYWSSGNQAVTAALLIGNYCTEGASGYNYPTTVTLNNCEFSVSGTAYYGNAEYLTTAPSIYVWSRIEEGNGTTLTYDAATYTNFEAAGSKSYVGNSGTNLTVNGKAYSAYSIEGTSLPAVSE